MHQQSPPATDDVRLPSRMVQKRYNICDRTLDRWLTKPEIGFPRPLVVNGRRYFKLAEIEAWERARAAATEAA